MTYDDIKHELISLQHMHEVRPDDHRAIANALRVLADELDPPSVGIADDGQGGFKIINLKPMKCSKCDDYIDTSGNCNCQFGLGLDDVC